MLGAAEVALAQLLGDPVTTMRVYRHETSGGGPNRHGAA
jgi:hypothetical protein